jgi:chromate transporter
MYSKEFTMKNRTQSPSAHTARQAGKGSFFMCMLKIGIIGFGGGTALIPVIEDAVTREHPFVSKEDYDRDVVAAAITPGALPVEIAAGLGKSVAGPGGMLLSSLLMALPGCLLTLVILAVLSSVNKAVLTLTDCLSIGITAFILTLLIAYVVRTYREGGGDRRTAAVIAGVFALTCGKNLFTIFGVGGVPAVSLDTLSVLGLAFFVIFFTKGKFDLKKGLAVAIVAAAFLFGKGALRLAAIGLMAALGGWGLISDIRSAEGGAFRPGQFGRKWAMEMAIWGSLIAAAAALTFIVTGRSPIFVLRGLLSSLISFGGGDAYLSVAEGMFVQTGTLSAGHFYGNLIPVANLLPGSILCKVLAGTGYYVGWGVRHSLVDAGLLWFAGFLVAVAGSGFTFGTVRLIYESLSELDVFKCLSKWIRPIVAGLLLNICLSLISQNLSTGVTLGISSGAAAAITAGILTINLAMLYRRKAKSGAMIAFSALASVLTAGSLVLL